MNFIYGFLLAFGCVSIAAQQQSSAKDIFLIKCDLTAPTIPHEWLDMKDLCIKAMRKQVQIEVEAAITYLAMGAQFARDSFNRPGFSKFFFDSASEERQHAIKIIEYLLMRGQLTADDSELLKFPSLKPKGTVWADGVTALEAALKLETEVTKSIRNIIKDCEEPWGDKTNDYHLSDYLIVDFLDEQYKGQRDLAGKISTLGKMMQDHGPLGEFLFDKKLLNGEL